MGIMLAAVPKILTVKTLKIKHYAHPEDAAIVRTGFITHTHLRPLMLHRCEERKGVDIIVTAKPPWSVGRPCSNTGQPP